jgi:hypothetical protein
MLRLWMSREECIRQTREFSRRERLETLAYRRTLANGVVDHFWQTGAGEPDVGPHATWEVLVRFLDGEPVREAIVGRLLDSSTDEQRNWFATLSQLQREELGNLIRAVGASIGDLVADWVEDHGAPRDWHIQIVYDRLLVAADSPRWS